MGVRQLRMYLKGRGTGQRKAPWQWRFDLVQGSLKQESWLENATTKCGAKNCISPAIQSPLTSISDTPFVHSIPKSPQSNPSNHFNKTQHYSSLPLSHFLLLSLPSLPWHLYFLHPSTHSSSHKRKDNSFIFILLYYVSISFSSPYKVDFETISESLKCARCVRNKTSDLINLLNMYKITLNDLGGVAI